VGAVLLPEIRGVHEEIARTLPSSWIQWPSCDVHIAAAQARKSSKSGVVAEAKFADEDGKGVRINAEPHFSKC
jgi:hypothetical protein